MLMAAGVPQALADRNEDFFQWVLIILCVVSSFTTLGFAIAYMRSQGRTAVLESRIHALYDAYFKSINDMVSEHRKEKKHEQEDR